MAGGGVPGGQVFGATDEKAAYPVSDKVTQDDIAATVYHLLGIDPETLIRDRQDRPFPLALGEPIAKLLGGLGRPEPKPAPAPRAVVEQVRPFTRMLRERGNRFITVALGNPDSEKQWELSGFSDPVGDGAGRNRALGEPLATAKYKGVFLGHFDYGWLVLNLAVPRSLAGVKLSLSGSLIPIPEDLIGANPRTLWQIPLPVGLIVSKQTLEITVQAPGWQICDIAVVGDEIREVDLARVGET
jgi:hypothetical protein